MGPNGVSSDLILLGSLNMDHVAQYTILLNELQIMSRNPEDSEIVMGSEDEFKQFEKAMNAINKASDITI